MTDNWVGVILNNYQAVMAIPWRKKFGITYCYDVPFIQQLGVFSKDDSAKNVLHPYLFSFCRYGDYNFNYASTHQLPDQKLQTNFILNLGAEFNLVKQHYSKDLLNNLKRAEKFSLTYANATIDDAVTMFKTLYSPRFRDVSAKDYNNFRNLCNSLDAKEQVIVRQVKSASGATLSIALFLKDEHRIYNIMNATTSEGKKFEANPYLLSEVIKEFAGTNLIFDFEGSDIPGIKQFYQKFGAQQQPYHRIHFNHLHPPFKWLKR